MVKSKGTEDQLKAKVKQQLKQKAGTQKGAAARKGSASSVSEPNGAPTFTTPEPSSFFFLRPLAKQQDLAMFFRQLSILIDSGYPILRGLTLLGNKNTNRHLAGEIQRIAYDVEKGSSLAKAMNSVPWYFSPTIVAMIEGAEAGGQLPEVLTSIAEDIEANEEMTSKIKQALAYPILTCVVAVAVFLLILLGVVPVFAGLYEKHNMELSLMTTFMVGLSSFLTNYWWLWVPVFFVLGWGAKKRMGGNLHSFDSLMLKIPIVGEILIVGAMARFAGTLKVLLSNGVPMLQSLDLAKGVVSNQVIQNLIQRMRDNAEQGKSLSKPLTEVGFLPPILVDMMIVGEESGKMSSVLGYVVATLRVQLDRTVNKLSVTLGPLMTLIVGVFVLFVILSLFIPYFNFLSIVAEGK